jgi:hypothetical protein
MVAFGREETVSRKAAPRWTRNPAGASCRWYGRVEALAQGELYERCTITLVASPANRRQRRAVINSSFTRIPVSSCDGGTRSHLLLHLLHEALGRQEYRAWLMSANAWGAGKRLPSLR